MCNVLCSPNKHYLYILISLSYFYVHSSDAVNFFFFFDSRKRLMSKNISKKEGQDFLETTEC
jgi:hypothetical protein